MSESKKAGLYRQLPAVSRLLESPEVRELLERHGRLLVLDEVTRHLDALRAGIAEGRLEADRLESAVSRLPQELARSIAARLAPSLRAVINATGVLVYTNAGRAPLAPGALAEASRIAATYCNLEYDSRSGTRGHRDQHFEARATALLGCEAATVCNNAAAALLLILNTLALGRQVIVSRGEMIEIGGSFRLPAILEKSGARLREVGTTNKTRTEDYREAIDDQTALILRVHPSNYQVVGFTQRPELSELAELSRETGVPLVHDAGSGLLFPASEPFLASEPSIRASLEAGADLVCFSGDKLLGGPQAGLILGRRDLITQLRRNPLLRALRADKLTYATLEWTWMQYETGAFRETLPLWRLMSLPIDAIRTRAEQLGRDLRSLGFTSELCSGASLTGGGTAPEERIPTCLLAVTSPRLSPNQIEAGLRAGEPPILSRIEKDRVLLDLRTVFPEQDAQLLAAFNTLAG